MLIFSEHFPFPPDHSPSCLLVSLYSWYPGSYYHPLEPSTVAASAAAAAAATPRKLPKRGATRRASRCALSQEEIGDHYRTGRALPELLLATPTGPSLALSCRRRCPPPPGCVTTAAAAVASSLVVAGDSDGRLGLWTTSSALASGVRYSGARIVGWNLSIKSESCYWTLRRRVSRHLNYNIWSPAVTRSIAWHRNTFSSHGRPHHVSYSHESVPKRQLLQPSGLILPVGPLNRCFIQLASSTAVFRRDTNNLATCPRFVRPRPW